MAKPTCSPNRKRRALSHRYGQSLCIYDETSLFIYLFVFSFNNDDPGSLIRRPSWVLFINFINNVHKLMNSSNDQHGLFINYEYDIIKMGIYDLTGIM